MTANTATLSVIRTFMSVPSRDLIDSDVAIDAFDGAADPHRRRLLGDGVDAPSAATMATATSGRMNE